MPVLGTRQNADQCDRTVGTIANVLRKQKYYPYHVYLHQNLREADFERRVDFCNWGLLKVDEENDLLHRIIWADEAPFCRNGSGNIHNAHYWSHESPHSQRQQKHQVRWSGKVGCGILGERIIGPYSFEDNLSGKMYTEEY